MPAGRFQVGRNHDATMLMSKGNYFPLRVDAPSFEGKATVGAPVPGVTADPGDIPFDKRPGKARPSSALIAQLAQVNQPHLQFDVQFGSTCG